MVLDHEVVITQLSQFFWPMARIGGLLLTMPVLSTPLIPPKIKLILLMTLALICAPLVPEKMSFLHFNGMFLVYSAQEMLLGIAMGFIMQIVFQVFIIAGQIIAMQSGLGFAVMVDPATRASVPLVSQLYMIIITLVFLSLNGHMILIQTLLSSFNTWPPGDANLGLSVLWQVIVFSGWMFKEAVIVCLPAILSLLIVSLSFGIMARVAPQLNIFSLGFSITLLMGILIISMTLPNIIQKMQSNLEFGLQVTQGLIP